MSIFLKVALTVTVLILGLYAAWIYLPGQIQLKVEAPKNAAEDAQEIVLKACSAGLPLKRDHYCFNKEKNLFSKGYSLDIEVFHTKPLIFIARGLFKNEVPQLKSMVDEVPIKPSLYSTQYGFNKTSIILPLVGFVDSSHPRLQKIFDKLEDAFGISQSCGHSGASVLKYGIGSMVRLHHDARGASIRNYSKYSYFMQKYKRFTEALYDCRHQYMDMYLIPCLYNHLSGTIASSLFWDYKDLGPPIASTLVQLTNVDGGDTVFPFVHLPIHTHAGDLLFWENTDDSWRIYDETSHGVCPVLSDERIIIPARVAGACNSMSAIKAALYN